MEKIFGRMLENLIPIIKFPSPEIDDSAIMKAVGSAKRLLLC
jgi:hypothetical protein